MNNYPIPGGQKQVDAKVSNWESSYYALTIKRKGNSYPSNHVHVDLKLSKEEQNQVELEILKWGGGKIIQM